jgi:hypothetical protein
VGWHRSERHDERSKGIASESNQVKGRHGSDRENEKGREICVILVDLQAEELGRVLSCLNT